MLNRIKRMLKHSWLDSSSAHHAMPPELLLRLQQQVTASEQRHSGELRIYVEGSLPASYLWCDTTTRHLTRQRAVDLFSELRVWDTAHNNGVLIYLLLAEHAIEIVADRGLNQVVDTQAWQHLMTRMRKAFQQGHFEVGLSQALNEVSELLVQRFPLKAGESNPNELPDSPLLK